MKFAEPPRGNQALHRTWLLWSVLEYLRQQGKAGTPYVPAGVLREYVLDLLGYNATENTDDQKRSIENAAYRLLKSLRDSGAVGQVNRRGMTGRKYFLQQGIGEDVLRAYENALSKEKAEE